ARGLVRTNGIEMRGRVRTTRCRADGVLLAHRLDGLLEVRGRRKLLAELPRETRRGPAFEHEVFGLRARRRPRTLQLRELRSATTVLLKLLHQLLVGLRAHEPVADLGGERDRLRAEARDVDRRRVVGQRVEPRVLDGEVLAVVT